MSLSIQQSERYVGSDRWKWSVWLKGSSSELDEVDFVTYYLHPTFHPRIRKVTDRSTNFKLKSGAWGTFMIRVRIYLKNGENLRFIHHLTLHYPDIIDTAESKGQVPPEPEKKEKQVFISSSVADMAVAQALAKNLTQEKIRVGEPFRSLAEVPLDVAIRNGLRSSDALIALVSDTIPNSVMQEMEIARRLNKPVVKVSLPSKLPKEQPADFHLQTLASKEIKNLAGSLAKHLEKL